MRVVLWWFGPPSWFCAGVPARERSGRAGAPGGARMRAALDSVEGNSASSVTWVSGFFSSFSFSSGGSQFFSLFYMNLSSLRHNRFRGTDRIPRTSSDAPRQAPTAQGSRIGEDESGMTQGRHMWKPRCLRG